MIDEIFFIGQPYEFSKNFFVYPPTVKQVLTCNDFGEYSTILLITQEEIEDNDTIKPHVKVMALDALSILKEQ